MIDVVVIFDIGKTNKKLLLFDSGMNPVYEEEIQFEEIDDDDGFSCDDIDAIVAWIHSQINTIQKGNLFKIRAINFSTHGATLVYIDENGKPVTPLYNYLKTIEDVDFDSFYDRFGGRDEFSRRAASPAYGMLNSGLQILWLKSMKPHLWSKVKHILHYPQYLSFTFTGEITTDYTSIGAHTAMWDFDEMSYHAWLKEENIHLPDPGGDEMMQEVRINGQNIRIGSGVHDSSASLVPFLKQNIPEQFVLVSTGTWIICMNPFSKEPLTREQLNNDCLCFMTPDKKQVKSSMQMLGRVHDLNVHEISNFFKVDLNAFKNVPANPDTCKRRFNRKQHLFFNNIIPGDMIGNPDALNQLRDFDAAYYQLMYEITSLVAQAIQRILDEKSELKKLYIAGGFNKNKIFICFLQLFFPDQKIAVSNIQNSSALGAAILMQNVFNENNV
nr:carbohydrate kinase [Bacteroidota bacterium]